MNLVATLVRGMRVEDALLQLQVTVKRASKTVYQVIKLLIALWTHNSGKKTCRFNLRENGDKNFPFHIEVLVFRYLYKQL